MNPDMEKKEYSQEILNLMNTVEKNLGVDAKETLKACAEIEKYAIQTNDAWLLGFACYHCGETYYMLNDGKSLFKYITRALTYLVSSGQWELVARSYNIMAITAVNRGNHPIAMDYYLTGLSYCKKHHLERIETIININIGSLYMSCGEYREAQQYIESAYRYIHGKKEIPGYYACMNGIYYDFAKCYLMRSLPEKALDYIERMEKECSVAMDSLDILYTQAFKARLYHTMGRMARRDECIAKVQEMTNIEIPIMDVFDDMCEYCELLLEIEKDDELWNMLDVLDRLTRQAGIINMQRQLVALKIRYYRKHRKSAEYLQAAGLYFGMSEIMEKENQYMIGNMLDVRRSLERANEKRREMEEENEVLQKKSEMDALTGLPNRFRLNEHMEESLQNMFYSGTSLAVEILDIDYFKQYNDNYGHQAGDICITSIAEELKVMQSEKILCARYGGDEFVIVYCNMTRAEVLEQADNLRRRIMNLRIEHKYSPASSMVTISQGICWGIPVEETKTWDYLHVADNMLYLGKKKSRNSVYIEGLGARDEAKSIEIEEPDLKS